VSRTCYHWAFDVVSGRVKCTDRASRWRRSKVTSTRLRRPTPRTFATLWSRFSKVWRNDPNTWSLCRTTRRQVSRVGIDVFIFRFQCKRRESCSQGERRISPKYRNDTKLGVLCALLLQWDFVLSVNWYFLTYLLTRCGFQSAKIF